MGAEKSYFEVNGQKFAYFKDGYETFKTLQSDFPDEYLHVEGRLTQDAASYITDLLSTMTADLKNFGASYLDIIKKIDRDKSWLSANLKKEAGPDPDNPISDLKCERGHIVMESNVSPNNIKGEI